jgi:hypothetical protein
MNGSSALRARRRLVEQRFRVSGRCHASIPEKANEDLYPITIDWIGGLGGR